MPILTHQIAQRVKGALAEDEDWWRVCYDTDAGEFYIEHEWDHVDPYNVAAGHNSGSTRHEIEGWSGPGKDRIDEAIAILNQQAASS